MVRSVRQVLENTEALSEAAVETSTSMGEMATSMREVDSSAEETARLSRQVIDSADLGQAKMVQTIAGMDDIRESTETAERVIRSLGGRASEIGAILDVIDDVADETNLLALNATIEAARAGDAGKGFAVVASEVKSLANQTAKATEEISQQIASMQGAASEAVDAIGGIGKTITEVNEIATAIASAVEEQGTATQDIARNVQEAARGTQEVTGNIAGVSQGAEETGKSANQVLEAAGQLSQQSEELRGAVDKFLADIKAA